MPVYHTRNFYSIFSVSNKKGAESTNSAPKLLDIPVQGLL